MVKYLAELISRFTGYKSGITKNPDVWKDREETPEAIQNHIDAVQKVGGELDDLNEQLALKTAEARKLQKEETRYADDFENLAIGLEKSNPDKLMLYNIELRKSLTKKSIPTDILHPKLADDTDGVGYIVSTNSDANANQYEWQKGVAADPSKTDVIPEMKFFKTTIKTSFVDDDVAKGVRYCYRVRAVNSAGEGPWSEAVSRVQ